MADISAYQEMQKRVREYVRDMSPNPNIQAMAAIEVIIEALWLFDPPVATLIIREVITRNGARKMPEDKARD